MPTETGKSFRNAVRISATLVSALFVIYGVEVLFKLPLHQLGIVPRTLTGLAGIIFAPLLHGSVQHLIANAVPLFVLLVLMLGNREYHPLRTLSVIWLGSGLGTWVIGRGQSVHIGASAVIFGLVTYLIVAGFKIRSWKSVIIAVVVFLFYGGIFYGVLPQRGLVSWEGHLCGALMGGWLGAQASRQRRLAQTL